MNRLSFAVFVFVGSQVIAAEPFKAGSATVEITPPSGFPMWGYASRHDAPSVGVLDPLKARAVVLSVGAAKLAIVSLDLGQAPVRDTTQSIRDRLKPHGISEVMLVASHTHHGPVLELATWPDAKKPYTKLLEDKLVDLIVAADRAAKPARWGVASHDVAFNRNRQSKRPDAPVDRALTVIRIEDANAKPIALLIHFASHATMTPSGEHKFSADWPGAMAVIVEKETGSACLFLQGAAGDLTTNSPQGVRGPAAFGETVGRAVLDVAKTIRFEPSRNPELLARTETFKFAARLDVSNPLVKAGIGRAFFPDLVSFYEREYREGVRPQMTVALLDGKVAFVGMSGELFTGHSLSLRRRARLDHALLCGYCNDYQQYFPTIEAASEGGYGTGPPVGMAELGAGEKMVDRALITLYRMRGTIP